MSQIPQAVVPTGPDSAAILLKKRMEESAAAAAKIAAEKAEKDKTTASADRTFYSGIDGSFYCMRDGTIIKFPNGIYVTNKPSEIDELDELCDTRGQYLITRDPQTVRHSDALILKEVAASQNGGPVQGTVNSGNILPR